MVNLMEAVADDIRMGINREKMVVMKSDNPGLNGKAIRVRPLRAREYKDVTGRVKVTLNDLDLGSAFALQYAACKITKPPTIITPGIIDLIDDMDPSDVAQIGDAILNMSTPDEAATSDFSRPQTGN